MISGSVIIFIFLIGRMAIMNDLFQNGAITEVLAAQNIAYILNDESLFSSIGYKVLKSQASSNFINCASLKYNGKTKLLYFVENAKSLKSILHLFDSGRFLTVIANLLEVVIDIQSNGFLVCQNLDLSIDKIFVDTSNLSVKLIYLPINNPRSDAESFNQNLRTQLIKLLRTNPLLPTDRADLICSYLSNPAISLKELYDVVYAERGLKAAQAEPASFKTEQFNTGRIGPEKTGQPEMTMSVQNVPIRLMFHIDKPEFIIGKNTMAVDGAITFNTAVSRVHCKIVYSNGQYFVVDLGSANGTFVNKTRTVPNQPCPINHGDIIRLANSDFLVEIV